MQVILGYFQFSGIVPEQHAGMIENLNAELHALVWKAPQVYHQLKPGNTEFLIFFYKELAKMCA